MISITIYGLDRFVVGRLSREMAGNLAKAFETEKEEIVFIGTENMVFHNGFEQPSWNVVVRVDAPEKYHDLEDTVKEVLFDGISLYAIHVVIQFNYFHKEHEHISINEKYPRFISEEHVDHHDEDFDDYPDYETDEYDEDDEEHEHHHHHHDEEDDEETLFTGDIFEGLDLD